MSAETERFETVVQRRVKRKLRAQTASGGVVLSGFGMFGMIGWSVAVPTVLGALVGGWIDAHHPSPHSWTLALLVAGLILGCANAWYWISAQITTVGQEAAGDE